MTYKVVTALKSKSGFVWDDVRGMGVTPEKRQAWNKLVKVREHISSLSTTTTVIIIRATNTSSRLPTMAGHIMTLWHD
jgi:hypothetical protein